MVKRKSFKNETLIRPRRRKSSILQNFLDKQKGNDTKNKREL